MNYFLKKRKWMAWLVLLTFLFTSFMPTNLLAGNRIAEAAETPAVGVHNPDPNGPEHGVTVSKTAKQVGFDEYEVTLHVSGGGTQTDKKTIDVVLVLDRSSSMRFTCPGGIYQAYENNQVKCSTCSHIRDRYGRSGRDYLNAKHSDESQIDDSPRNNATQAAAKGLIDTLMKKLDDVNVNVGVVSFGKTATKHSGNALVPLTADNVDTINGYITAAKATQTSVGTNTSAGIYAAKDLLDNSSNDKYVILLSDGLPTYYYESQKSTEVKGSGSSTGDSEWTYTGNAATALKGLTNLELYTVLLDGSNSNWSYVKI